jgi:hypothetical protein
MTIAIGHIPVKTFRGPLNPWQWALGRVTLALLPEDKPAYAAVR